MTHDPHASTIKRMSAEADAIRAVGESYERDGAERERTMLRWQVTRRIEQLEADGHERGELVLRELYGVVRIIDMRTRRAASEGKKR